jgi:hypothetical protein
MHETAAEQRESRSPEAPADIVILFILMYNSSSAKLTFTSNAYNGIASHTCWLKGTPRGTNNEVDVTYSM